MNRQLEETHLHDLVRDTIARWRDGEEPDAAALLTDYPDLSRNKRLAVDLIYEEFCLRSEAGDPVVRSTFCDRFPGYQASLVKMLEVHDELERGAEQASAPQPLVWPHVGESFLGYQLVESLGRGALARVFLAREIALGGRLVVVKISQHGASEAHMLGKIAHPAIVPIYSVRQDDTTGWTVICMPLVGTATATDLIDAAFAQGQPPATAEVISRVGRQSVPVGAGREASPSAAPERWPATYADGIARFGWHLAEGLRVAHDAGIMHRDIKPSNVLLGWSGLPMLLDFNLSTDIGLVNDRVGGTLPYMAPELMQEMASGGRAVHRRSSISPFDPRSDIFSLGAVLYHLLTGHLPAQPTDRGPGGGAIDRWLASRQRPVESLRARNAAIDPELECIVLRCLELDPERRYATAQSLGQALRRYVSPLARSSRLVRKHRRTILLAAVATAAAAVGGIAYAASLPPHEERLYAEGLHQYSQGQYAAAAATFAECRRLRPDWDEACFAHGQALRQTGSFMDARAAFLALSDRYSAAGQSLAGFCLLEANDPTGAFEHLSLAVLHLGAVDPISLVNYAHCLRTRGEFRPAMTYLNAAIAADSQFALAYFQRALCSLQPRGALPPLPEAIEDARRACELEPACGEFHYLAAVVLARASGPDSAGPDIARHARRALAGGYPLRFLQRDRSLNPWLGDLASIPSLPPHDYQPSQSYGNPSIAVQLSYFMTQPSEHAQKKR